MGVKHNLIYRFYWYSYINRSKYEWQINFVKINWSFCNFSINWMCSASLIIFFSSFW